MNALKAQGISRSTLPYKAPFQPFGSWFALISTAIITIFKGFDSFMPFKADSFVTSYVALPVFVLFYFGYKLYYRTHTLKSKDVDLVTGMRAIDEEEERFVKEQEMQGPQSWARKMWDSL